MNKLLMMLVMLILFTGCSNMTTKNEENTDLLISDALTSISGVNESFDRQNLSYEITIINKGNVPIIDDSIKVILTEWINEKLIEHEITEKRFNEDNIIVKGYVVFDSKGLTKNDIVENKSYINGINIETMNGKEILIEHKYD
ncbi:hypothetical protein [Metabacillus malikii]|uniref:DUF3221 domain-containing protein n=1 Tax=Metabacillus malikii TaxID=1504265 RepID=A0ABT9ZKB8_9BACI|nr:hypothetical protein [Metabacillus malikii]MDQ0232703.1 hypothetical protein [Metabacillus malikii]